jgi:hypothetical protein
MQASASQGSEKARTKTRIAVGVRNTASFVRSWEDSRGALRKARAQMQIVSRFSCGCTRRASDARTVPDAISA